MESQKADNYNENCVSITLIVIFIILIIIIICWCSHRCYKNYYTVDDEYSTEIKEPFTNDKKTLYNPLYTSSDIKQLGGFMYTQPPGDVDASMYAMTNQGTNGEFLPLQGRQAGVFMKNSAQDNTALPSNEIGMIGGYPNYTDQVQTSAVTAGFNDFGNPFQMTKGAQLESADYSNSYTIDGANRRVCNPGQRCPNLMSQDWWPHIKKGVHGFSTQASDAMVECKSPKGDSVENCKNQGGMRFLRSKMEPRWKSVFQAQ